jgi:hypothetical protein
MKNSNEVLNYLSSKSNDVTKHLNQLTKIHQVPFDYDTPSFMSKIDELIQTKLNTSKSFYPIIMFFHLGDYENMWNIQYSKSEIDRAVEKILSF